MGGIDAYSEDRVDYPKAEMRKNTLPLDMQDKLLSELNEVLSILTDRLNPVLTPDNEVAKELADRDPQPPKSEVHQRLDSHNYQIRKAITKASTLIDRLEI